MKKNVYSVRDIKSVFGNPFIEDTDLQARRSFQFAVSDPGSALHNFPSDFQLYRIGEFDLENGVLTSYSSSEFILVADASSFVGGVSND